MYPVRDQDSGFPPGEFSDQKEEWGWGVLFSFVNHQFLDLVTGNTGYSDFENTCDMCTFLYVRYI